MLVLKVRPDLRGPLLLIQNRLGLKGMQDEASWQRHQEDEIAGVHQDMPIYRRMVHRQ
jgi:hypothetical protein